MSPITNKPVHHVADDLLPNGFKKERTRVLTGNDLKIESDERKSVFYWMQRDVRTVDNWALALASYLASSRGQTLRVIYALPPPPMKKEEIPALVNLPVNARHADFLMGGVELVYKELKDLNIPLHLIQAKSHDKIGETVCKEVLENDVSVLVSDFSPIREYRQWMEIQALPLLEEKQVPFYQVDTHNVVPVWAASDKREYAARTIRPKIHKVMDDYLQDFPAISANKNSVKLPSFNREEYENHMNINNSVKPVDWAKPGTDAAMKQFEGFCRNKLDDFGDLRNDPNAEACSNLSPWINHGHISAQRLTMKIDELGKDSEGCETYVEESVIRRELADNFVYYTLDKYDSLEAAYDWAKDTLDDHKTDDREYIYSLEELENGKTHEDVWNAAQLQLVQEGHMHGFMRMYWSKKILKWSKTPEVALKTAQYLNDKYSLDGRDCNSFTGVGWSIMGIHDHGWQEHDVFGKVRYMNYNGCRRKFDIEEFVQKYKGAAKNAEEAGESSSGTKKRSNFSSHSSRKSKATKT